MNNAYELVQSDLLIGNHCPQSQPATVAARPPTTSPTATRRRGPAPRIQWPASTPRSVVATAGSVLSTPSGS